MSHAWAPCGGQPALRQNLLPGFQVPWSTVGHHSASELFLQLCDEKRKKNGGLIKLCD